MYKKFIGILICILFIGVTIPQIGFFDSVKADLGDIILSFAAPGSVQTGLTWDGTCLWCASQVPPKIYKLDPSDGSILSYFDSAGNYPMDLAWDGTYLWNPDRGNDHINKYNPSNGDLISWINSPGSYPFGLTWDGQYLWNSDWDTNKIYKLDPSDGSIITSFDGPSTQPTGLAWGGTYIWSADQDEDKIYKLNPSNGNIIISFNSPGAFPKGLAWDGTYLWCADAVDDKIYKLDVTENQPPVADANGPYYGNINAVINLDGSGSTDSDGSIVSYAWDLDNDGQYDDATGPTPSWSWSIGGSHPISLKVTDNDAATDTDDSTVYINEYPVANADGPYYGNKDESVILDGSGSSDSDGTIVSYEWDLDNDGSYDDTTGETPSWSWPESGTYTIGLKVTDDDDATDTDTSEVFIELDEYPPSASFIYTPEQPKVGDTISFDASGSSDPDGNIVSYSWDFGDDTTGSGMITSHIYSEPARYTIFLTVVDNDNLFDSASVNIKVGIEGESPVAYFTYIPDNPCVNESIMFNALSSFSPGGIIVSYNWSFGDDTTGTGMFNNHSYVVTGNYSVNLTVTDNHGLNGSIIKIIRINLSQIPNIVIEDISGKFGITALINNIGTGYASDVIWSIDVEKDFGVILSGSHTEDAIDVLAAGASATIQSSGLRGIGLITITVQANDVSKKATAFLLGPLVLRVNEI